MRLLLAEDDEDYSRATAALLRHAQYVVDPVSDGTTALAYGQSNNYDGIVLDIMMPGMDGLQVLRALRESGVKTPVLMLTAKVALDERIAGLDAGADDYLPKPFDAGELLARVRALLRRSSAFSPDILSLGNLSLDCGKCVLTGPDGSERLLNKEFQLLELFLRNPHIRFSTDRLMEKVWGWDADAEINVVWANISNLRRKLSRVGADFELRAARGLGYTLEAKTP